MADEITLSSATRNNLLSLQNTSNLIGQTQQRLDKKENQLALHLQTEPNTLQQLHNLSITLINKQILLRSIQNQVLADSIQY